MHPLVNLDRVFHLVQSNVAPANNNCYLFTSKVLFVLQRSSGCRCSSTFGQRMRLLNQQPNRVMYFIIGNQDKIIQAMLDD